ncbi:MAG: AMP-binding protein, partial [Waddliaceae bacterium]
AEVFLHNCERMGKAPAMADMRSGILAYPRLKMAAILFAEAIRHYSGKYIGILLPASVGAYLTVLACELAGKVPLMINWTIGSRHLEAVRELSKVEVVLTSWAFLERLDTVDLTGVDDILVMLESVRREFTLFDKVRALIRSKRSAKSIMRILGSDKLTKDDTAVLLFTSGTESMPKGVPLTHENILSNQRAAFDAIDLFSDDVLLGILPPFHVYGFNTSGLMGLLSGIRSSYFPNPTDGKGVAKAFETWGVTVMSGAPSFIKGMLKAATPEQLKTMRYCATGAEKAPPELFQLMAQIGKEQCLLEGYGVTECSPMLTVNRPGKPRVGVGPPAPGVELCVVHPETHEILPVGTEGLILARGPNVFKGYINPGLASPFITVNEKEWYNTGDIGFLDEETRLTISGRKKRFIKVGGEMISLLAIETALLHAAPEKGWPVQEEGPTLAIIAKERPGGKPTIILITTFDSNVDEVNQTLRDSGISNLVRISKVIPLEEIQMMGTGKINYRILEEEYLSDVE